jgi:hypothetical protein
VSKNIIWLSTHIHKKNWSPRGKNEVPLDTTGNKTPDLRRKNNQFSKIVGPEKRKQVKNLKTFDAQKSFKKSVKHHHQKHSKLTL